MLTFNVIFQCRPGERETFLGELRAAGIDAASRAEPGNRGYDFYLSVNDPDALLLIEKYTEDAAVFAHAQTAHVQRLVALKEKYVADMSMERYEGDGAMPAFGEKEAPSGLSS